MKKLISLIILIFLFLSCSVEQDIYFRSDGSAEVSGRLVMTPLLLKYLQDFSSIQEAQDLLPEDEILAQWNASPFLDVLYLELFDEDSTDIRFLLHIHNWKALAASLPEENPVLSYETIGSRTSVSIDLNRKNFYQVYILFPQLDNTLFHSFAPFDGDTSTQEDFLFMAEYALGDGGATAMEEGLVYMTVRTENHFYDQSGGITLDDGMAVMLSLVDILHLLMPIKLSIQYGD